MSNTCNKRLFTKKENIVSVPKIAKNYKVWTCNSNPLRSGNIFTTVCSWTTSKEEIFLQDFLEIQGCLFQNY